MFKYCLRLLLVALPLFFAAGCEPKKEEPAPNQNPNPNNPDPNNPDPNNPDPNDIDLPGDDIKPSDLLTSEIYKHLVIEIAADTVGGSLSGPAIGRLYWFLQDRLNKSSITIRDIALPNPSKDSVGLVDVKKIEKAHRTRSVVGDTVFVWIECINAKSSDKISDFKLADTYGRSSIAFYMGTLNYLTSPDMVSRFTIETYLLQHEFGHLLGLVNGGTSMQNPHQDEAHGNHCTNPQCLMYWKADENLVLRDLLAGENDPFPDELPFFDVNCMSDLQAAGGK